VLLDLASFSPSCIPLEEFPPWLRVKLPLIWLLLFNLLLDQVLATPIVSALEGTPNAWLGELLGVFNKGDIAGFALLFDARKVGKVAGCSSPFKNVVPLIVKLHMCDTCVSIIRRSSRLSLLFASVSHS